MSFNLRTPEFTSRTALYRWCNDSREAIRPIAPQLHLAGEELRAVLRQIPRHMIGNIDSKYHAMMVSRQLHHAANGIEIACQGLVGCYLSFERRFVPTIKPERTLPRFQLDG